MARGQRKKGVKRCGFWTDPCEESGSKQLGVRVGVCVCVGRLGEGRGGRGLRLSLSCVYVLSSSFPGGPRASSFLCTSVGCTVSLCPGRDGGFKAPPSRPHTRRIVLSLFLCLSSRLRDPPRSPPKPCSSCAESFLRLRRRCGATLSLSRQVEGIRPGTPLSCSDGRGRLGGRLMGG